MKALILTIGASMIVAATTLAQNMDQELTNRQGTVQDVEGNVYRTVTIGDQIWLAENLRSTRFQDGSAVRSGVIPKDDEANLLKYGRLYNWYDVADERNLCPVGWHVASDDDWKSLERAIGMPEDEVNKDGWRGGVLHLGVQLKEAQSDGLFAHFTPSQINRYQFSARPAGVKWHGWYITQGDYSEFWTTSSASDKKAIIRTLAYSWWNKHKGEIRRATSTKDYMFSVRCVKNTT